MSTAPDRHPDAASAPAPAPAPDGAPPADVPGGGDRDTTGTAAAGAPRRRRTAGTGGATPTRGRKGVERREALLDAAEEVLVAEGGPEWTMRAVAAAAGVRLGHLQYYFPTHADLVAAVLERVLRRSAERLAPLLAAEADTPADGTDAADGAVREPRDGEPSDGPAARIVAGLLHEQEDARLMRLFVEVWALAARDATVAAAVRGFYGDYREQVAAFLARRRPELPEEVRRARAGVFVMLIEGASMFRSGVAGEREPATDEALVRTALALLGP